MGTRNETARKHIAFLVALVRGMVHGDPNINPTIRFLTFIELSAIKGNHEHNVVWFDVALLDGLEIVGSLAKVIIYINQSPISVHLFMYPPGLLW